MVKNKLRGTRIVSPSIARQPKFRQIKFKLNDWDGLKFINQQLKLLI